MLEQIYISEQLLKLIKDELTDNMKRIMNKSGIDINDYINNIYHEKYTKAVKMNEKLRYEKKRMNQTKSRWAKGVIKEIDNYSIKKSKRGIHSIIQIAESLLESEPNEFYNIYKCNTIEEYSKTIIDKINKWANDDTTNLTDFPFFNTRNNSQQASGIESDIAVIVGNIVVKQDGLQDDQFSMKMNYLIDNAYVSDGLGSYKNLIEDPESQVYTHSLKLDNNKEVITYIDKKYVDKLRVENKNVRLYDSTDDQLIATALMKRDSLFYTHKRLTVNIGELTKLVYKSDNARNYKAVVDRLTKMAYLKFGFMEEGKGLEISSLFDLKFPSDDDDINKGKVFLYFSDKFYNSIIQDQVTHIYTKELQKIESSDAVSLAFLLQKERLANPSGTKPITYSYSYFSEKISFRKRKNYKEGCEFIEEAITELVNKNTIVKAFQRRGLEFHIVFYPVEQEEMHALLKYKEEKKELLSELQSKTLLN